MRSQITQIIVFLQLLPTTCTQNAVNIEDLQPSFDYLECSLEWLTHDIAPTSELGCVLDFMAIADHAHVYHGITMFRSVILLEFALLFDGKKFDFLTSRINTTKLHCDSNAKLTDFPEWPESFHKTALKFNLLQNWHWQVTKLVTRAYFMWGKSFTP